MFRTAINRRTAVVMFCTASLGGNPAAADRHCYPAMDGYFAARQHILVAPSVAAAGDTTTEDASEASTNALAPPAGDELMPRTGPDCPQGLAQAREQLADAVAKARICGCGALIDLLEAQLAIAEDGSIACILAVEQILSVEDDVRGTVDECHH